MVERLPGWNAFLRKHAELASPKIAQHATEHGASLEWQMPIYNHPGQRIWGQAEVAPEKQTRELGTHLLPLELLRTAKTKRLRESNEVGMSCPWYRGHQGQLRMSPF